METKKKNRSSIPQGILALCLKLGLGINLVLLPGLPPKQPKTTSRLCFQGLQSEPALPAFDLAARHADLVLVLLPQARKGNRILCKVLKNFVRPQSTPHQRRRPPRQQVFILEPANLPRPQKLLPHTAQLVFLKKAEGREAFFVLQYPGTLLPWTKSQAKTLEPLLHLLLLPAQEEKTKGLFQLALGSQDPRSSALALLALCRTGEIHEAKPAQRQSLRNRLGQEGTPMFLRDLSARALASLRDRQLAEQIFSLLKQGKAKGLGSCFGNILRSLLGKQKAENRLRDFLRAAPKDPDLKAALKKLLP